MCRHVGYVGPAVPLAALLYDPPHSLEHQSWAPADMRAGGTINADGFGVGWYPASGADPVRYRRGCPMCPIRCRFPSCSVRRSRQRYAPVLSSTSPVPCASSPPNWAIKRA